MNFRVSSLFIGEREKIMNEEERNVFWESLLSLEGNNLQEEIKLISTKIKYPSHIYRFRSATTDSLECLRTNRIYFSSADKYDDPFDSFLHVRWNNVVSEISNAFIDIKQLHSTYSLISSLFGIPAEMVSSFFASHSTDEWGEVGKIIMMQTREFIQRNSLSICFSEDELNETLWLKYAANHSGFAMEYSLSNSESFFCGNLDKCSLCPASKLRYPLYPVFYSDKRYDATAYAKAVAMSIAVEKLPSSMASIAQTIKKNLPKMAWQRERISLIKHKSHEYDKEWRILYPNGYDLSGQMSRPFIVWRPSSIILGLRISLPVKNLLLALAREAGIPKAYQCIINKEDVLDVELVDSYGVPNYIVSD